MVVTFNSIVLCFCIYFSESHYKTCLQSEDAVGNAVKLDGSTFKERVLKVTHKRVNDPNFFYQQDGGGRGGG